MKAKSRFCCGFILVVILAGAAPAAGDTYCNYYDHGGTWSDVNKTWLDDSFMCWAAAASNILAWGGWGTAGYNTADQIYNYLKSYYGNIGGSPDMAYGFWFTGMAGEGGFYPGLRLGDYLHWGSWGTPMLDINHFLHGGDGVHIRIEHPYLGAHALTVWGYDYDPAFEPEDYRYYTHLYITDSDDLATELQRYAVRQDDLGRWFFDGGRLADWQIQGCTSLERNPFITLPNQYFWVGREALEGFFDLKLYLSFDYKWERPFPEPQPGDPCLLLVQIFTKNDWLTIFQMALEQDEGVWKNVNIEIDEYFAGLQQLRFLVEGNAKVCLYRLHPVPLPEAVWLLGFGFLGLAGYRKFRKSYGI